MENISREDLSNVLTGNYLLVTLTIRRFSGFKQDKKASEQVTTDAHATSGSAKVVKDLLAGARGELKAVYREQDAIRGFIYNKSLPWTTNNTGPQRGPRLVPAVQAIPHGDEKGLLHEYNQMRNAFLVARDEFLKVYDLRRQQAIQNLGSLADPSEYPTLEEMTEQFGVELDISPVPAPADFSRIQLPTAAVEALGRRVANQYQRSVDIAMGDMMERIRDELKRMITQFTKVAEGENTRMYQSLLGNMEGLVNLLRGSNFTNSDKLDELVANLTELTSYDIKTIKANPTVAGELAAKAADIDSDLEEELYF